jgi:predicted ATPase
MNSINPTNEQNDIFEQIFTDVSMESKLIVKNFGPIKDVNLTLKNVNVFIGAQATGKSALAKIFTIFKAPRKFFYKNDKEVPYNLIDYIYDSKEVNEVFKGYNIDSFLNTDTEIEFESELHSISYINNTLKYEAKLFNEIKHIELLLEDFTTNKNKLSEKFGYLCSKFLLFDIKATYILYPEFRPQPLTIRDFENLNEEQCKQFFEIVKSIEEELSTSAAVYIPAERNFINIIKDFSLSLQLNKVPIPQHILSFGAELEKVRQKEFDLDFIQKDLKYKRINGEDKIYINDNKSILLGESSSGIQSVVPLVASILERKNTTHRSFVIEEPELNLFPLTQYELIKFLESQREDSNFKWQDVGTIHTYTTHSPYILSSLNNLLYAYKVRGILYSKIKFDPNISTIEKERDLIFKKISKVVNATINPETFTAYQFCDGFAKPIFSIGTGLIEDNYIDIATDRINDDFDALMELIK